MFFCCPSQALTNNECSNHSFGSLGSLSDKESEVVNSPFIVFSISSLIRLLSLSKKLFKRLATLNQWLVYTVHKKWGQLGMYRVSRLWNLVEQADGITTLGEKCFYQGFTKLKSLQKREVMFYCSNWKLFSSRLFKRVNTACSHGLPVLSLLSRCSSMVTWSSRRDFDNEPFNDFFSPSSMGCWKVLL